MGWSYHIRFCIDKSGTNIGFRLRKFERDCKWTICDKSCFFSDNENDHVMIRFEADSISFNMNSNIEEVNKNNYTVTWTPSIDDIGVLEVNLFFFDQFHTVNTPVNFQIIISEITIPTFVNNPTDISVFVGQQTNITLPQILNPSNASINFRYLFILIEI